jgi:hypothetical protein
MRAERWRDVSAPSLNIMRIRNSLLAFAIAGAVLGLAACAAPTPVPTATPTTEVPSVIEAPLPRLPLTCDDLLSPESVAAFANAEVPLADDGTGTPRSWWDVVYRQSGTLACVWGVDREHVALSVFVVPDSEQYFHSNVDSGFATYYERYNEVGDRSVHSCAYGQCSFSVVVGDYLIGGYANRSDLMDELDLLPLIVPVLTEVVAEVEAAIPAERDAWGAPDGVLRGWGWGCDEDAPVTELADIFGMTDVYATGTDWDGVTAAIFAQVEPSWCTLSSEQGGSGFPEVVIIEGGAWVASGWEAEPPTSWGGTPWAPIELEGVGAAYMFEVGGRYDLVFAHLGSVVSVSVEASTREEFLGWAAEVAELVSRGSA